MKCFYKIIPFLTRWNGWIEIFLQNQPRQQIRDGGEIIAGLTVIREYRGQKAQTQTVSLLR
jgi:hypothetical protein